ncbi:EF-P beta-lysylation protein EpmB [Legionella sp. MW5194]|uniref:EF-P beta-lysylation protein EpmB n=1 Tax=Legionella sp. MW5194 TaxID=2662448 RepID=UPI00193E9E71|nr:EF-P beta-lysylation protein EpmB [Legionella sp. MW5194]QRN04866.1 EF-P beta-lysylation protein EpmB [Legionella sp. MW5194]
MRDASVSWQKILAQGFATKEALLDYLSLPHTLGSEGAEQQFKTRVPRGFARRMQAGNPNDPLLLQVLAVEQELHETLGYSVDPLGEAAANPMQGLIHKYQGRVLLTLTGACAVNCRYCFRRHFPYQDNNPGREGWRRVIDYIREDSAIHEVILSGGDPLMAADLVMGELIKALGEINHVRTLRFHTRIPIVLPERINATLLDQLAASRLRKVIVIHCNHPQEIDESVAKACLALHQSGCQLLNQSVLLKGINDEPDVLAALSERLFDCNVLPYYLHVFDKVKGGAHFDMPDDEALAIYRQLQALLPGYLVPRLVREEAGKKHKTLLV